MICENYMKFIFQRLEIKSYWHTLVPICLGIVYDSFRATVAELTSGTRACLNCKAENIYYLALYRKDSPTSGIQPYSCLGDKGPDQAKEGSTDSFRIVLCPWHKK